jgi:hypothetical protein
MLLKPTLNRSLLVSSHQIGPIDEENRVKISTLFYQTEIYNGSVVPGSQKTVYGLKELSRVGVVSVSGIHFPIEYNDLKGHFKNKILWRERFLFTPEPLDHDFKLITTVNDTDLAKGV